jgi:hypothetical protein
LNYYFKLLLNASRSQRISRLDCATGHRLIGVIGVE